MATLSLDKKRLPLSGRHLLRRVAIVAAAPALALTVFALPSATPAYASSCAQYALCTWQNSNYSGTQWNFTVTSGQPGGNWWYVGSAANDKISSIINNHTFARAWFDKDCPAGGNDTWIGSLKSAPNLANNKWPDGSSMNDSISAWAVVSSGTAPPAHGSRTAGGC